MYESGTYALNRRAFLKSTALAVAASHTTVAAQQEGPDSTSTPPPAPLFRDPIYDGAADPTVVWNRQERAWWIVYTQRRANVDAQKVAWVHGSDIGIASSSDGGQTWVYRGVLKGLEFEWGRNTFWAPAVIWQRDTYHLYLAYIRGVPHDWSGERSIIHYTSRNLLDWHCESTLSLTSNRVIDPCVHVLPNGLWRMWYKDEGHGSHIYWADSNDLYDWRAGDAAITDREQEGPIVFRWHGYYWMLTDPWTGLGVYRSEDARTWTRQENILNTPGRRLDDGAKGQHPDVVAQGDDAYVFYFTHPQSNEQIKESVAEVQPYAKRRTSLQVAKLDFQNGKLVCDRDEPFHLHLRNP